jgi:predicted N-acetyltransferase YhbS
MTSQTSNTDITYRRMTEDDLPSAHGLTQALRWAHRLEDWQFMHRLGTGFVAQKSGAVIGTGLCWKFGNTHASLGLIIVSSEQQGKGIGRELMSLVLEELGDRCVMLNATPAGQPLYEKLGFVPTGTVDQHQGTMQQTAPIALAAADPIAEIRIVLRPPQRSARGPLMRNEIPYMPAPIPKMVPNSLPEIAPMSLTAVRL